MATPLLDEEVSETTEQKAARLAARAREVIENAKIRIAKIDERIADARHEQLHRLFQGPESSRSRR